MQRIWNLNWENITYDHDISGLMRGLIDWGVIEGGTVVGNKLQPVQAIIPLVRSNGQKILAFFESDEVINLPTAGNFKVFIEVDQSKINFGGNNAEDWSGIAKIKTWPTLPSQNFLLLATVTAGVVKDERKQIPKVWELAEKLKSLDKAWITEKLKNVDTLTKDMKQVKIDISSLKIDTVSAGESTVVFTGSKTGNSTEQRQVVSPRKSLCQLTITVSSDRLDKTSCSVKIKKDWKVLGSCGYSQSWPNTVTNFFLLPAGDLTLELYSRNLAGYPVSMSYSISMQ